MAPTPRVINSHHRLGVFCERSDIITNESTLNQDVDHRITQWMDSHRSTLVSLVQQLIQLPSVNAPPLGDETVAQKMIGHWFRQLGLSVDEYDVCSVDGIKNHPAWRDLDRNYVGRPNVMACLPGSGTGRSLVFTGHIDTVELSEDIAWNHDPFAGEYDGESIFGLGAFDMKGGLAAGMMAIRCLVELGVQCDGTIYLESVVDEEYGGSNATLAGRLRYPAIDAAILMEPTNLHIATGHRSTSVWILTVTGQSSRSFSGEATTNPARTLIDMMQWLGEFLTSRTNQHHGGESYPWEIDRLHAGPTSERMGTRIPPTASVIFWVEGGADEDPNIRDQMARWLNERFDASDYELRPMIPPLLGSQIASDHPLTRCLQRSMHPWGVEEEPITAPFACDGAMFNRHSRTPVILFGPEGGNAHGADEFVRVESVLRLSQVLARTAVAWCGGR